MAKIVLASYIKAIHGRIGNFIYYNVNGYQYARSFTIPINPKTPVQQINRNAFGKAAKLWQSIPEEDKSFYNRLAYGKPLSGYNIFVSMQKRGISTEVLKLIHRHKRYNRYIDPSYILRDTSVYTSSLLDNSGVSAYKSINIFKKPPGIKALAA